MAVPPTSKHDLYLTGQEARRVKVLAIPWVGSDLPRAFKVVGGSLYRGRPELGEAPAVLRLTIISQGLPEVRPGARIPEQKVKLDAV